MKERAGLRQNKNIKGSKDMIIGITGGIGSGKSYVLSIMERQFGCLILEADVIARKLQQPSEICYSKIVQLFGKEILSLDGRIDRQKLGQIVFSDKNKLAKLNRIVHPAVKKRILEEIKRVEKEKPDPKSLRKDKGRNIVIEAALLLEDHYDKICDTIWYIYAKEEIRRRRLKEFRGYTEEKIDLIIKNQLSEERFIQKCDCMIKNESTEKELIKQIEACLEKSNQAIVQRG